MFRLCPVRCVYTGQGAFYWIYPELFETILSDPVRSRAIPMRFSSNQFIAVAYPYIALQSNAFALQRCALPLLLKAWHSKSLPLRCISLPLHFTARHLQSLPSHLSAQQLTAIAFHSVAARRYSFAERRRSMPLRCSVTFLPSGTGLAHCFATGRYRKIFRNPAIPARPFHGRHTGRQR